MILHFPILLFVAIAAAQIVCARYDGYPSSTTTLPSKNFTWYSVGELTEYADQRSVEAAKVFADGLVQFSPSDGGTDTANSAAVSLHHRALASRALSAAASRVSSAKSGVTVLDLTANALSSSTLRVLGTLLPHLPSLRVLVFDGNDLSSPEDLRAVVSVLRRHPSIRQLHLSGCHLNDDSMDAIALLVRANRNITHLDISANDITEEGLSKLLASGVEQNAAEKKKSSGAHTGGDVGPSLQVLDLSYNPLLDAGVLRLAVAMEYNKFPLLEELLVKDVRTRTSAHPLIAVRLMHGTHI